MKTNCLHMEDKKTDHNFSPADALFPNATPELKFKIQYKRA